MSVASAARRVLEGLAPPPSVADPRWMPDWSMPGGMRPPRGLDDLAVPPARIDDLPVGIDDIPDDVVDPGMIPSTVPDNWQDVIPTDVQMRPGETLDNLEGAATPLEMDPSVSPGAMDDLAPNPNDLPGARAPDSPRRYDWEDDPAVNRADPTESSADARARALALAAVAGAGAAGMYDFWSPSSGDMGSPPPSSGPAPGGLPPGGSWDPPPGGGPMPGNAPQDPADAAAAAAAAADARARLRAYEEEQRIRRLSRRAGIPVEQGMAMAQAGYDEQDIGHVIGKKDGNPNFDQRKRAYQSLRVAGHTKQDADLAARQAAVVRRAQSQYNPMELLDDDWRRYVIASQMLGRRAGASPSDVARAREQAKAAMEARLGVGRGFQPNSVQEQIAQQQLDQAKPVAVRAQEHAAAGRLNHPDVLKYADDLVHANYSSRPGMLGVSSRFTDAELNEAAARMATDLNIDEEDARGILVRIQQDRNRSAVASSIVASFYDR